MASNGNFGTWNPLADYSSGTTFSNGNCTTAISQQNQYRACLGPAIPDSGKWYIEFFIDYQTAGFPTLIGLLDGTINSGLGSGNYLSNAGSFHIEPMTGKLYSESTTGTSYTGNSGSPAAVGNADAKVGIAIDRDNNKLWFAVNNTWINVGSGVGDPANDSNPAVSSIEENLSISHGIRQATGTSKVVINCGQDSTFGGLATAGGNADDNGFGDFFYAPPSGFLSITSANLPISDDIDPAQTDDNFPQKNCGVLKNSSTGGDSYTGLGFQPDLVWVKWTGGDQGHGWFDSSRGTSKVLNTNSTASEATSSGLTSFDSDGYTMGTYYNQSGREYMGWCWRANGGTTSSNTDGQTTSTVQANQEAGFSIVEYAGTLTSSGTKTIGHGLSKAPELIIIKNPNKTGRWFIQHTGLTSWNYYISFNTNTGETNASGNGSMSAPTDSVFYTNWTEGSNESPYNHIAYCWHSVEGYSKFGKYIGNSNADGPFIYTGFRPQIIIIKGLVTGAGWLIKDDTLDGSNPGTGVLEPNQGGGKYTTAGGVCDILSNGFKVRTANAVANSTSYDPYVYMAWGSVPFKYNNSF